MAQLWNVFSFLPWGCGFSQTMGCSPEALGLPEEPQNELLHSWKSPCSRICPRPPLPRPFPPCTQALEEPVWALRAELPPSPACLRGEGRKGTVEREVPSSLLWWGLVLPSPCQSGLGLGVCWALALSPVQQHTYWEAGPAA